MRIETQLVQFSFKYQLRKVAEMEPKCIALIFMISTLVWICESNEMSVHNVTNKSIAIE